LENIWDAIEVPEDLSDVSKLEDMWNNMSNEKMIGILHAFVLIMPILKKSMNNCQKTEDAIEFLHINGFSSRITGSHNSSLESRSVPSVLTRSDCNHIQSMETSLHEIQENQLETLFSKLKYSLDKLGQ